MKIEKLNENQIRCTLNKADLADRELHLQELAYGTERAKALFRDMMQQASNEVGFEVDDIPLMIEAIPVSPDCLVLIITKVEDPEELDTRFSKFTKSSSEEEEDYDDDYEDDEDLLLDDTSENSNSIMDVIENIVDDIQAVKSGSKSIEEFTPLSSALKAQNASSTPDSSLDIYRIFAFQSLQDVSQVASHLVGTYDGQNSLYKNPENNHYYLIVNRSDHSADAFNFVCNIMSEYGQKIKTTYAMPYYYEEHFQLIIQEHALQTLASI